MEFLIETFSSMFYVEQVPTPIYMMHKEPLFQFLDFDLLLERKSLGTRGKAKKQNMAATLI